MNLKKFATPIVAIIINIAAIAIMMNIFSGKPEEKVDDVLKIEAAQVVKSDNLSVVSSLASNAEEVEYLYVIDADREQPVYVMKRKDDDKVTVVQMPLATHRSLEAEILLPNAISYQMADQAFVQANHEALSKHVDIVMPSMARNFFAALFQHAGLILMALIFFLILKTMPKMSQPLNVVTPDKIEGTLDDLVGLEDIKAEVAHLKSMIGQRDRYAAHNVDKPFNVMLSGPAGTGKTKLAGYIAKDLGVPIIYASGSNLETGYVGGGSSTLKKIHAAAESLKDCVIFLDEAQSLLMQRGQSSQKWADDTPNTLLTLLDGLPVQRRRLGRILKKESAPSRGIGIVWIVASNFNENSLPMDEAVLRRFPVKIGFRMPSHKERKLLLEKLLKAKEPGCVDWDKLDLDRLAGLTEGLSPALITSMTDAGSRLSIEENVPIDTSVLIRAFERINIGLTDRETTGAKERDRARVAIHEMGHFVAHVAHDIAAGVPVAEIKRRSTFIKVSTESIAQQGALGYMLSTRPENSLLSIGEIEQTIVELYGGLAAEEVFYGKQGVSLGATNDIQKATALLRQMIERASMYSEAKLDYSAFKDTQQDVLARIEAKSAECYARALDSVRAHRDFVEGMKDVLMKQYILEKDEIFARLESHLASNLSEERAA